MRLFSGVSFLFWTNKSHNFVRTSRYVNIDKHTLYLTSVEIDHSKWPKSPSLENEISIFKSVYLQEFLSDLNDRGVKI